MRIKINFKKLLKRFVFLLFILSFLIPLLSRLMPSGMDNKDTNLFFKEKKIAFKDTLIKQGGRMLRFVCAGNDTMPLVFFIHGSPGSWDAFKDYLSDSGLLVSHYLVAINRPGYGGSGEEGVATLQEQVDAASAVFKLKKNKLAMSIVSHSYGGPIAVKFAIQYPSEVRQLILIAPTISPEIEEHIRFKRNLQTFSKWWLWRWTLSADLKNSTKEMQPLPDEVRKMEKDYPSLKIPVTEIHGTDDALAPFGNQTYVQKRFVNASVDTIKLKGEGHLIPFTMPQKIIAIIQSKLK